MKEETLATDIVPDSSDTTNVLTYVIQVMRSMGREPRQAATQLGPHVKIRNVKTGAESTLDTSGVFVAIGHSPASELVKDQLELLEGGYVKVEPGTTRTSIPGVIAAGDLTDHVYRQAVTSAGMGCMAALDAERFLAEHHEAGEPAPDAAQIEEVPA